MGLEFIGSPQGQTAILGIIFFFVFTAYYMIQGFSSKLYGETLGSNVELTVYAVFTVFCFVAPPVTNKLGCRVTMFVGIMGYAALVAVSLVYFESGSDKRYEPWVIVGGGLLGIGAAFLWTAQGKLILQYSDGTDTGNLFALFWGLFNMSAVAGGFLTFGYFASSHSSGNVLLYVIFLALIIIGGCGVFTLKSAERMRANSILSATNTSNGHLSTDERLMPSSFLSVPVSLEPTRVSRASSQSHNRLSKFSGEILSKATWLEEMVATIQLFGTREMRVLSVIMLYTGLNQPYQLVTFGNRFVGSSTLGLLLAAFYFMEILGAAYGGRLLDTAFMSDHRKRNALQCLMIFLLTSLGGYAIAFAFEWKYIWTREVETSEISTSEKVLIAAAFVLWGFSDAMIQGFAYWFLNKIYIKGADQSRGVGFYKMVQSAGWCIGFALVPTYRCPPVIQLLYGVASACIGTYLTCLQLNKHFDRGGEILTAGSRLGDSDSIETEESHYLSANPLPGLLTSIR